MGKQKAGPDFNDLGRRGGRAVKKKYGNEHFRALARKRWAKKKR